MNPIRKKRLERQIMREVSSLLVSGGLKDPRLASLVSVTRVEVSNDQSFCKVFVSVFGDAADKKRTWRGLINAAGFIQYTITKSLRLRIVPKIRFFLDPSLEMSEEVMEALDSDPPATDETSD